MTEFLLDHPWPLDAALDVKSEGFRVLLRFSDLVRAEGIEPVRFVAEEEFADVWKRINYGSTSFAQFCQFAELCVRKGGGSAVATPVPEPPGLTTTWKQALSDSMQELDDWRTPQIIVPQTRRPVWDGGEEIAIRCEDHDGSEYRRVLAVLEHYEAHSKASADLDPWDVTQTHQPDRGAQRQHPCRLPKPPDLERVALEDLQGELVPVRARGWRVILGGGRLRYYFIPSHNWRPDAGKSAWREGRAFSRKLSAERDQVGYLDYEERIWVWDRGHRHWDVQTGEGHYVRVSHTGDEV